VRVAQEQVEAFHEKYGYPHPDLPEVGTAQLAAFRRQLILEELNEYVAAVEAGDLVEVADGITDLAYLVLGTAVSHGIDLQPLFDEVHRSNMTKDLHRDQINKPLKSATFQPPRIADLLLVQLTGLE
jgi:predicted HAD superfamily Cof-like phosphohydrolase